VGDEMDYWGGYNEIWQERREELLREAERSRLERRLRAARRERSLLSKYARRRAWRVSVGGWVLRLEKVPVEER
jgi:hypothetical protein